MKIKNLVRSLSFAFAFSLLLFCFGISSSAEISEPEHTGMDPHFFYDVVKYDPSAEFYMNFSSNGVEYTSLSYVCLDVSGTDLVHHSRMYYSNSYGSTLVYEYVENGEGEYESTWADPSYKTFVMMNWVDNDFLQSCSYSASSSFLFGGEYCLNIDYIKENFSGSDFLPFPFVSYGVEMSGIHIYGSREPYDVFEVYFVGADGVSSYYYGSYDLSRVNPWECDEKMTCLTVDDYYAEYETISFIDPFLSHYEPTPPPEEPFEVIVKGKFTFTDPVIYPSDFFDDNSYLFNFMTEDGEVFSGMYFHYFPNSSCSLRFIKLSDNSFYDCCSWSGGSFNGFKDSRCQTIYFTECTISSTLYSWLSSVGIFDETVDVPSFDPDIPSPPDLPDTPTDPLSILPGGSYVFVEHLSPYPGSIPGSYIEIELTFFSKGIEWGELSVYNSANNKCVGQVYYMTTSDDFDILEVYKNDYNGYVDTWESYGARIIRIPENVHVPTAFYNWFITNTAPFDDGGDDTTSFDNGVLVGFERGYEKAKEYYYKLGLDEGSKANGEEFLPNFFGSILDALDNLTIIGGLSFLDVIKMLVGLFVCLWVLKLLGGG